MTSQRGPLFQPTFVFPMVSVGVLVAAFLVYYFPVTAEREASLNRLAFRSLAAVSDSLANRAVSFARVLEQRSKRGAGADPAAPGASDFTVTTAGTVFDCRPQENLGVKVVAGTARVELICGSWKGAMEMDRILPPYLRGTPSQLFDDVLLTDADGTVLYQSISTGSRITSIKSAVLATVPATGGDQKPASGSTTAPFAALSQSSTLVSVQLAGEPYRLYLVPVPMKLPAAAGASHLVVAGVVRASRFRADSMAIPGSALIVAALLVLITISATWPLLKFNTMGPTDRVPRRSAVYLFLSTLATIIFVGILAIHLRYTVDLRTVDENLRRLAESIERNLRAELSVALRVLGAANSQALRSAAMQPTPGCRPATDNALGAEPVRRVLSQPGRRLSDYPYFDRIFWTDSRGYQHFKWEAGTPTSPTYVGDRDYFVETTANRLWQFADADAASARFRVDSIVSRNTGEYRAVISQPAPALPLCDRVELRMVSMVSPLLSLIDPILPPDYGFAVVNGEGHVLFHSTGTKNGAERMLDEVADAAELRSALFARQGKLLTAEYIGADHRMFVTPFTTLRDSPWSLITFHNLSEGAALHFGRIVLFVLLALVYFFVLGTVLIVLPLARGPREWIWPRAERRGSYIHLTLTAALLAPPLYLLIFGAARPEAVLLLAVLVPVIILAMGLLKVAAMRPAVAIVAAAALAAVLAGVIWTEPRSQGYLLVLAVGVLAPLGLLAMPHLSAWLASFQWPSLRVSYAAVWAAFLAVIALLPCMAFFRIAYDYHGNLSTRRQQVQTMAALADREARVKSEYGGREVTEPANAATRDVARWLFVRRRLEETLDRYDAVLMNPGTGQVFSPRSRPDDAVNTTTDACEDDGLPEFVQVLASLDLSGRATLTRTLTASSSRSAWEWCRAGVNRLRVNGRQRQVLADADALSLPPTRALFKAVTNDSVLLHSELVSELPLLNRWSLPLAMLALAATGCITFLWVMPTLEQLFQMKVRRADALPELALDRQTPLSTNLILLVGDAARASELLRTRDDLHRINVAEVIRGGAPPDLDALAQATIVLEEFDHRIESNDANRQRLELLERVTSRYPDVPIVIVCAVDPAFALGATGEPSDRAASGAEMSPEDVERWAAALGRFTRRRVVGPASTLSASLSPGTGRSEWSASTTGERIALYQLAHDGWVNPRNEAALVHLQERGLIGGTPLRHTSADLESFVRGSIGSRERKAWAHQDRASAWDGIRLMFIVLIIGVAAAALFFSQQSVLGLIATALGVLTPLTKLLSEARSFRSLLGFAAPAK